jgi:hypothetical protein
MAFIFGSESALTPISYTVPTNFQRIAGNPFTGQDFTIVTPQDRRGNFIDASSVSVNPIRNVSLTLMATLPGGAGFQAAMGGVTSANVPCWTSVTGRYVNNDFARIELVGHIHTAGQGNEHHSGSVNVSLPSAGFGILACDAISGTLPMNLVSVDYAVSLTHLDKQNRLGNHLIGHSFGGRIDVTMTFIDDTEPTIDTSYYMDSNVLNDTNVDFATRVIRCHKYFALT